jgi:hypothetical protein
MADSWYVNIDVASVKLETYLSVLIDFLGNET